MYQDDSQTLPSVEAPRSGAYDERELLLTIIFHPDTARIGHTAIVPRCTKRMDCILGRSSPDFARPGADTRRERDRRAAGASAKVCADTPAVDGGRDLEAIEWAAEPLDDVYISRRALELVYNGNTILVRRIQGSSRCQLGKTELLGEVELNSDQLEDGVTLMLAHRIVLMLRQTGGRRSDCHFPDAMQSLVGGSRKMAQLRQHIHSAAECDLDVLIRGETGSGKERVAEAIHQLSSRSQQAMVSVNMAAVPAELAAAALFGAARGAYTGADQASIGYFRQAQQGTLFLDEIGDTPLTVQPLLLRALEEREVQAVGGQIERVDLRVISATDAPLEGDSSGFKSALRHRLAALEILVPPLRQHSEDIGELLMYFLRGAAQELGADPNIPHSQMEPIRLAEWASAFCLFANYSWPGNIRELRNLSRQLLLSAQSGSVLDEKLRSVLTDKGNSESAGSAGIARPKIQDISGRDFDEAMASGRYEPKAVAQILGVSRTSVYRRIASSSRYQLATELAPELIERAMEEEGQSVEKAAMRLKVSAVGLRNQLRKKRIASS